MKIENEQFERWYLAKMNKFIRGLPDCDKKIEVIHTGGGIDIALNGASLSNVEISGLLSEAHAVVCIEINEELKLIADKFGNGRFKDEV